MKALIGTWKLVSQQHRDTEGNIFYPRGEDAIGQLMYSADGYMCATIMSANRKRFQSGGLFSGGTDVEKTEAMDSFMAYCGRYRIESNKIIHVVEISLFPNLVGNEEIRYYEMTKDSLTLTTPPFMSKGREWVGHITWKRSSSPLLEE